MKTLKIIISSFKNTKIFTIIFFLLSIILNYLVTYVPIVIQYFIDTILHQKNENELLNRITQLSVNRINFVLLTCIILGIIELTIILFTYIRNIIKNKIIQEFQYSLKLKLFSHIQNMTYENFYSNTLADLVQNSTDDIKNMVNFIEKQFVSILDILLIILFAIIQLSTIEYKLSIIMIISTFLIILLSIWYYSKSRKLINNTIKIQNEMYTKINDNYKNLKFIKLNNLEKSEKINFEQILKENEIYNTKKIETDATYHVGISTLVKMQPVFIFILSGYLYMISKISIGSIYVTLNYSNNITKSFSAISEMIEIFNLSIISYKRLENLFKLDIEKKENKDIYLNNKTIVFKNVDIIVNNKIILENINFIINENEKVLLVGATGSGKSILLKTLTGFYDYTGSIKIGDYELRDLDKQTIRKNICLVVQDSYIFSKTIEENIKILNKDITCEEMLNIAEQFTIHEYVKNLKEGYNTFIGAKGIKLSKGQKQRLVLSRSYTDIKPIMIFDDSLSAVDLTNKNKILNSIMEDEKHFTKIFVDNDLSLVHKFNKIIYLNNQTAIVGNHLELLNNEKYRKIYELNQDQLGEEYV